jgi:hypothetical protein
MLCSIHPLRQRCTFNRNSFLDLVSNVVVMGFLDARAIARAEVVQY